MRHAVHLLECLLPMGVQTALLRLARGSERWEHSIVSTLGGDLTEKFGPAAREVVVQESFAEVAAEVRALDPDLVVWHHWSSRLEEVCREIAEDYPLLCHCHGSSSPPADGDAPKWPKTVLVGTELWPWGRDVVRIQNPVDVELFALRPTLESSVVMTYCRPIPTKNPKRVLDVWHRVSDRLENAALHIYGFGLGITGIYFEEVVTLASKDRSVWLIPDHPPRPPFEDAAIWLQGSSSETFCNVAAEAMAAGLPVVAWDAFGPSEYVGAGGLLCETEEAMANALVALLEDNEQRRRTGATAREIASELFRPEVVVPQHESLMDKVVAGMEPEPANE